MSKFKQFLNEGRSKSIKFDESVEIARDNCKDAIRKWMSEHKIFRTFDHNDKYLLLDPRGSTRTSSNTLNYYTLWINNHESWKSFPTREVICSGGSGQRAFSHGASATYAVLPFDGSNIGICPQDDIWDSFGIIETFGFADANDLNNWIYWDLPEVPEFNWGSFKKKTKKINIKEDLYRKSSSKSTVQKYFNNEDFISLYDFMEVALDPKRNGFDLQKISKYKLGPGDNKEVWIDQPCLMVDPGLMVDIIKKLGF